MAKSPEKKKYAHELLHLAFNQDQGCFAVGTSNGFRVHNCEPFKETFRREFANGGIGIVEMLFRSNILALVGGGTSPKYPPTKVMIWDDHQGRCIGELAFRSRVRRVALRRDLLAVALEHKVLVYAFSDLRLASSVETAANAAGLLALSTGLDAAVLACPGLHAGQVRVEACDTRRTRFVQAHTSALGALALTPSGKHMATASEKGTLIRIWATTDGTRLQELRRGTDTARIHCLAFSTSRDGSAAQSPEWLAVTSDRGTAHVFSLRRGGGRPAPDGSSAEQGGGPQNGALRANPVSKLAFVSSYLPMAATYFSSERSFAQFHLPDGEATLVGFGREPGILLLLSQAGFFYRVSFDPEMGGPCEQLACTQFMEDAPRRAGDY